MPVTRRGEYEALERALYEVAQLADAAASLDGVERWQANKAYERAVVQSLVPALLSAMEKASGELNVRDVVRIAENLVETVTEKGLYT